MILRAQYNHEYVSLQAAEYFVFVQPVYRCFSTLFVGVKKTKKVTWWRVLLGGVGILRMVALMTVSQLSHGVAGSIPTVAIVVEVKNKKNAYGISVQAGLSESVALHCSAPRSSGVAFAHKTLVEVGAWLISALTCCT